MSDDRFYTGTEISQINGVALDLVNPVAEDVSFDHIAKALGNTARFSGGTNHHCSVAQHSCVMATQCWELMEQGYLEEEKLRATQLACILHDAHEAYVGDLTVPVRNAISKISDPTYAGMFTGVFNNLSERVQDAILEAADRFDPELEARMDLVHDLDKRVCMDELNSFSPLSDLISPREPLGIEITPIAPYEAGRRWLQAFNFLRGERLHVPASKVSL